MLDNFSIEGDALYQLLMNKAQIFCDQNIQYVADFYSLETAEQYYQELRQSLLWRQEDITMFGKTMKTPRLQAWYGDEDALYKYSNIPLIPQPWDRRLSAIKNDIEEQIEGRFNSVLANYYRNGKDSMGWHSDNEKELGVEPLIASVSLGEPRRFLLKHKTSGEKLTLNLQSGSLLIMRGDLQQNWQHSVPKTMKQVNGRINLTFRKIIT